MNYLGRDTARRVRKRLCGCRRTWHAMSLLLMLMPLSVQSQSPSIFTAAWWNVENLFDTRDDPHTADDDFTPRGDYHWTRRKLNDKIQGLYKTLLQMELPDVVGLAEVENAWVLKELCNATPLRQFGYRYVHYDSPDRRGVDVGLIYNPKYFKLTNSKSYPTIIPEDPNHITRDQLVVSGLFDGEPMHFIVMHWPSRAGGEKRSMPGRLAAATLCRHIADSILNDDPNAKIIMMGDFNDYPDNKTVTKHLRALGDMKNLRNGEFFNPMYDLHKKGIGTNYYRDVPGVLDQTILTPALLPTDYSSYQFKNVKVHNKEFLKQHGGKYNGYPFRTFGSGVWMDGYSDHFPVYVVLLKKV